MEEHPPSDQPIPDSVNIAGDVPVTLRINGREYQLQIDARTTLLISSAKRLLLQERRRVAITDNVVLARCM